jgi:hypothetical protein
MAFSFGNTGQNAFSSSSGASNAMLGPDLEEILTEVSTFRPFKIV